MDKNLNAALDIRDFGAAETNTAAENAAAIQKALDPFKSMGR